MLSAGELRVVIEDGHLEAVEITNQSTGYCPEPGSWPVVAEALDRVGIGHPGRFTNALDFRVCTACGQVNIIKDGWFACAVCGGSLPTTWHC